MTSSSHRFALVSGLLLAALHPVDAADAIASGNGALLRCSIEADRLVLTSDTPFVKDGRVLFVATGTPAGSGSQVLPYRAGEEGSTVFLPFPANALHRIDGKHSATVRTWNVSRWEEAHDGDAQISGDGKTLRVPGAGAGPVMFAVYEKDLSANAGWGALTACTDPSLQPGAGDQVMHQAPLLDKDGVRLAGRFGRTTPPRMRIYQILPRFFSNTNPTRKPNGSMVENGCGKFSGINGPALDAIKDLGVTHVWLTGVLQQATATDHSAAGQPADDPDLLKGIAGSPYAIRDYFDVCPDYAEDPAHRLGEFKELLARIKERGMKPIIDFVPNHVARSHASDIRPDLDFGAGDDRTKAFHPANNFYYLPPEQPPGPPLRLPTVDAKGNPVSPTCLALGTGSDGRFAPETESGRVTGNNAATWTPSDGDWYETVKLNYGFAFQTPDAPRAYPTAEAPETPLPDTWKKMDAVLAHWQQAGVEGFRCDMAHMIPPEFWAWAIVCARARDPECVFLAEAYDNDPAKVRGTDPVTGGLGGSGNVMFDLLNAGFDAVYDDPAYDALKEIYDGGKSANDVDRVAGHPWIFAHSLRYAENHDEVRLAAKHHWSGLGMAVGRPVAAILFALSRGPVMLYHGQETGEPADGAEGFGGDDGRTSIFDYWSMPEFAKWVNDGAFDGGGLSPEQKKLRNDYRTLLRACAEPAFSQGDFIPLNAANKDHPDFGKIPGEKASGRWLYAALRQVPGGGQTVLVVANLNPKTPMKKILIELPRTGVLAAGVLTGTDLLGGRGICVVQGGLARIGSMPPLSAAYFELVEKTEFPPWEPSRN